jgi:DnaJ family protein A protein 2
LRVLIESHPVFKRVGADLFMDKEISLLQALCGIEFEILLLNGEILNVSTLNNEIINPNETKTLKGKGMPIFKDPTKFGNLYIHFKVVFPKVGELTQDQLILLSKVSISV